MLKSGHLPLSPCKSNLLHGNFRIRMFIDQIIHILLSFQSVLYSLLIFLISGYSILYKGSFWKFYSYSDLCCLILDIIATVVIFLYAIVPILLHFFFYVGSIRRERDWEKFGNQTNSNFFLELCLKNRHKIKQRFRYLFENLCH